MEPPPQAEKSRLRRDPFTILVAVACVALSVLVVLLARQNRVCKAQLAILGAQAERTDAATLEAGDVVPAFNAVAESGETTRVEFANGPGRTLLLVFSPDCHACRDNMPVWNRILAGPVSPSVRVLGIRTETPGQAAPPQEPVAFPVYSLASPIEKLPYVPATILVDAEGRVLRAYFGVLGPDQEAELQAAVRG